MGLHNTFQKYLDADNNDKLFDEEGNNLIIYPNNIEDDIKDKFNIDIGYDTIINYDAKIFFFTHIKNFNEIRILKKYFLYFIPHCVDVQYDRSYLTVILTRKNGLDAIKTIF